MVENAKIQNIKCDILGGGRNFEHKEIGIKNSDYRTQLLGFKNTIFSTSVGLKNTLFFE